MSLFCIYNNYVEKLRNSLYNKQIRACLNFSFLHGEGKKGSPKLKLCH